MEKIIYKFGNGITEGNLTDKKLLGGKGANLQEMSALGLPVPRGFTIPSTYTFKTFDEEHLDEIVEAMEFIKGDNDLMPLVSVRSGAAISMPGMMDTVLNVGLTHETIPQWYSVFGRKVAYDSYCRLIRMMGESIMGVPGSEFDKMLQVVLDKYGLKSYYDLHSTGYCAVSSRYKKVFKKWTKKEFPKTLKGQLRMAIKGVFESWNTPRAKEYRKLHNIPDDMYGYSLYCSANGFREYE